MVSSKIISIVFLLIFFRSSAYASRALLISSIGAVFSNPYLDHSLVSSSIAPASTFIASAHESSGGLSYSQSSAGGKSPLSSNFVNGDGGGYSSLGYGSLSNNDLESGPTLASPTSLTTVYHAQTPSGWDYFFNGFNGEDQFPNSVSSGGGGGGDVIFDENKYK